MACASSFSVTKTAGRDRDSLVIGRVDFPRGRDHIDVNHRLSHRRSYRSRVTLFPATVEPLEGKVPTCSMLSKRKR